MADAAVLQIEGPDAALVAPRLSTISSIDATLQIEGPDAALVASLQPQISDPPDVIRSGAEPVFSLPRPLHDPDWASDVGERLIWMQRAEIKTAHLRLDPPELGEVEIHITLRDAGAEVWFSTPSTTVRDALETALPRLRDMFGQHGLQLDQAGVFSGGGSASRGFERPMPKSPPGPSVGVSEQTPPQGGPRPQGRLFEAYA